MGLFPDPAFSFFYRDCDKLYWTSEILERYLISSSKLAFSVVKGAVPETTRNAVSRLFRLSDRLP